MHVYSFIGVLSLAVTLKLDLFLCHPLLFQYHLSVTPINRSALWVMCHSYTLSIDAVASVFVMKCSRICASHELIYFKYNLLKLSKLVVQMWGSDTVTQSVCMYEYKCCFDIMEQNHFETINNLLLIHIFLWNGEKKIWKITEFRFGTCWWTNSYFHLKFENMNLIFNWKVSLNRIFKCLFYRYKSTKWGLKTFLKCTFSKMKGQIVFEYVSVNFERWSKSSLFLFQ